MKRGILGLLVVAAVGLGLLGPWDARARAQGETNIHLPAVYIASISGKIGWDFTPDLLMNIFMDADRTFNDLVPVIDPKPGEADQVVHPEAWDHHVIVLRLNLGLDESATQLDLHDYLAKFQHVLGEQTNMRNRRVVVWVQRTDDLAALMIPMVPEAVRAPNARAVMSEAFIERFTSEPQAKGQPAPTAPDLSALPECNTTEDLFEALGLPANTTILAGDSQKILQRWIEFRDEALDMAQKAVGEDWDAYEKIINDPNAEAFRKINARRDISNELRAAHLHVVRYDDLAQHPTFAPLAAQLLEKMKTLSETPAPRAR